MCGVLDDIWNMQQKNFHANMLLGMVLTRVTVTIGKLFTNKNVSGSSLVQMSLLAAVFHALWETEQKPKAETAITLISQKPTQLASIHLFW